MWLLQESVYMVTTAFAVFCVIISLFYYVPGHWKCHNTGLYSLHIFSSYYANICWETKVTKNILQLFIEWSLIWKITQKCNFSSQSVFPSLLYEAASLTITFCGFMQNVLSDISFIFNEYFIFFGTVAEEWAHGSLFLWRSIRSKVVLIYVNRGITNLIINYIQPALC